MEGGSIVTFFDSFLVAVTMMTVVFIVLIGLWLSTLIITKITSAIANRNKTDGA